jgi:hypothetical protein
VLGECLPGGQRDQRLPERLLVTAVHGVGSPAAAVAGGRTPQLPAQRLQADLLHGPSVNGHEQSRCRTGQQ